MIEASLPAQRGAFMAKLGAWLQIIPLLEIAGQVFGITRDFAARYHSGWIGTHKFAAMRNYEHTCETVAVSMALTGLVLVTLAITSCRFRARWLFEFMRFYGVLILGLNLVVVFGQFKTNLYLPFGLFFLIYALVKQDEFVPISTAELDLPDGDEVDE